MSKSNNPKDYTAAELREALLVVAELVVAGAAPAWAFNMLEAALAEVENDDVLLRAERFLRQSRGAAL